MTHQKPNNFSFQFDAATFSALLNETNERHMVSHILNFLASNQTLFNDSEAVTFGARSVLPAKDIHEFFECVAFAVDAVQDYEGIDPANRVEFRQAFVDIDVQSRPVITWRVIERKPGSVARGKPGTSAVQEYSFHPRGSYDDPQEPNMRIVTHGKFMDHLVDFCIISTDPDQANRIAIWFESVMEEMAWYFQYKGINRVLFQRRNADEFKEVSGNKFHIRPLIYFVRTEKILTVREGVLRNVAINIFKT